MARLRLICGPAGSGKTQLILREIAQLAQEQPFGPPLSPPILLLVPEQQTLSTERAVAAQLARLRGNDGAVGASAAAGPGGIAALAALTRVRVLSFTRLARLLAGGVSERPLSETARELLVYGLLPQDERRAALAPLYSDLLAELQACGTTPEELFAAARELEEQAPLRARLGELAELAQRYAAACERSGAAFESAAAQAARLLAAGRLPELDGAEAYCDSFASFTPVEEDALDALLLRCGRVSVSLLLDPARLSGPLAADSMDAYAPTRGQYARLLRRAAARDATVEEVQLREPRRFGTHSSIARAVEALIGSRPANRAEPGAAGASEQGARVLALEAPSPEQELRAVGERILMLVQGEEPPGPLRFGEISVITRDMQAYGALARQVFGALGIPAYFDARASLAQHPLVELTRVVLRSGLGLAQDGDYPALLRSGLADPSGIAQEKLDALDMYAHEHGISARHWPGPHPFTRLRRLLDARTDEDSEAQRAAAGQARRDLAELSGWRDSALAAATAFRRAWARLQSVGGSAAMLIERLEEAVLTPERLAQLEQWQQQAQAAGRREHSELQRQAPALLAALLAELRGVLGGVGLTAVPGSAVSAQPALIEPRELVRLVEQGLAGLSAGAPPLGLDRVLFTEIERGRHHPVRASFVIGLTQDGWPRPAAAPPLLSDSQRAELNRRQANGARALLPAGSPESAAREPYLAVVALTRASDWLCLTRPLASAAGAPLAASPYYDRVVHALQLAPQQTRTATGAWPGLRGCFSVEGLCIARGLSADPALAARLDALLDSLPAQPGSRSAAALSGLRWGLARRSRLHESWLLDPALLRAGREGRVERASPSRLESFARCPFQHFARYQLRLSERQEPEFDAPALGSLYHAALEREVAARTAGADSSSHAELDARLTALAAELARELDIERLDYIIERARQVVAAQLVLLDEQDASGARRRLTELRFGDGAPLPALRLETAHGELSLAGRLDRLDIAADGALEVLDYKLGGRTAGALQLFAGEALQLCAYLLAASAAPPELGRGLGLPDAAQPPLHAAAASYQSLSERWSAGVLQEAQYPRTGLSLDEDGALELKRLPEGLPEEAAQGPGLPAALLRHFGGRMLSGVITPSPLRRGAGDTACANCGYRAVCRFDPLAGQGYRSLQEAAHDSAQAIAAERVAEGGP